jgi:hypothetical protein
MSFSKAVGKSFSNFSMHMDRFIGERVSGQSYQAHLLSVVGGDAQIAAASAIISEQESFTVEGPGLPSLNVTMGTDAQCYRASIQLSTSKRPLRHLVAVSKEFGAQVGCDATGRTLLADSSPDYLWGAMVQIFGLPAVPGWAKWFHSKLDDNLAIGRIYGLGCRPVVIAGTGDEFMRWLSEGIRKSEIALPEENGPGVWPKTSLEQILLPTRDEISSTQ